MVTGGADLAEQQRPHEDHRPAPRADDYDSGKSRHIRRSRLTTSAGTSGSSAIKRSDWPRHLLRRHLRRQRRRRVVGEAGSSWFEGDAGGRGDEADRVIPADQNVKVEQLAGVERLGQFCPEGITDVSTVMELVDRSDQQAIRRVVPAGVGCSPMSQSTRSGRCRGGLVPRRKRCGPPTRTRSRSARRCDRSRSRVRRSEMVSSRPSAYEPRGRIASVNAGCVTSVRNSPMGGTPGGIMSRSAWSMSGAYGGSRGAILVMGLRVSESEQVRHDNVSESGTQGGGRHGEGRSRAGTTGPRFDHG